MLTQAEADWNRYSGDAANGFAQNITFTDPSGLTVTITGLATKHHLGFDTDGNMVNSQKASVAVSEQRLTAAGYTVRNSNNEVALIGHKVDTKDNTGILKNFIVVQNIPDETVGMIVCFLKQYE
jgi:hypothetical protein